MITDYHIQLLLKILEVLQQIEEDQKAIIVMLREGMEKYDKHIIEEKVAI